MEKINVNQSASDGIAIGKAFIIIKEEITPDNYHISKEDVEKEIDLYEDARKKVVNDLKELGEASDVFAAHLELVQDINLVSDIKNLINDLMNSQIAVEKACKSYEEIFNSMEDAYMRERGADIKDIKERLLYALKGKTVNPFEDMREPSIVVANDLTPSDTVNMDLDLVLGFVTQFGGVTSHVSIIAKNLGLPALVGVSDIINKVKVDDLLILDASGKQLIINPDSNKIESYKIKIEELKKENKEMQKLANVLAKTKDGKEIKVYANVGSLDDIKRAKEFGIDGIGLFRSEFIYMDSAHLPTEEEQFNIYKQALKLAEKPITIRTLDIGGDKELPYFEFEKEENPFLGWRAIRISLDRPDIFKPQLRALLRASTYGMLRIMYPMIVSEEELDKANEILEECKSELDQEEINYDKNIEVGIMIETPASVFIAKELAKKVDFFSIGTNDLTQYITAVDRGNRKVAHLYDSKSSAVLRAIKQVIEVGHEEGIEVGMCGELAGDETVTSLLLSYGLDEFSMAPSYMNRIKSIIINN